MDITPLIPGDRQVIDSYGPGRFLVSGEQHAGSVIVFSDRTVAWPVASFAEISLGGLDAVIGAETPVDVLIIGCGARMQPVPAALRTALRGQGIGCDAGQGIGCDAMDTGAACRTYNVLLSEGRRVAAALIPLPG
jgi:uncharacterized protein